MNVAEMATVPPASPAEEAAVEVLYLQIRSGGDNSFKSAI